MIIIRIHKYNVFNMDIAKIINYPNKKIHLAKNPIRIH